MHYNPSFGLWAEILGISCHDHVVSGYKFIMRYYSPGDSIHTFGVARGAHTACVLARMLQEIGLLQRGESILPMFCKHMKIVKQCWSSYDYC